MHAAYRNLSVKSVTGREYDLGVYIKRCVFHVDGKKAAIYEEPKEMSCWQGGNGIAEVTYAGDSEAAVAALAKEYLEENPSACEGWFGKEEAVKHMLSELAWAALNIKECEKEERLAVVYPVRDTQRRFNFEAMYAGSEEELRSILKRTPYAAYTDFARKDYVNSNVNSVCKEG